MAQKRTEIADAQQLRAAVEPVLLLLVQTGHAQTLIARSGVLYAVEHARDRLPFRLRLPDRPAAVRPPSCKAAILKRAAVCLVKLDLRADLRVFDRKQLCQIQLVASSRTG